VHFSGSSARWPVRGHQQRPVCDKPIRLYAGAAMLIAVGWLRAWRNRAGELLPTLNRIE
jgi:hypothetical protein